MKKIILSLVLLFTLTTIGYSQEVRPDGTTENQSTIDYCKSIIAWKVIKDVKGEDPQLTENELSRVTIKCSTNLYAGSPKGQATYLGDSGNYITIYFQYHPAFQGPHGYVAGYYTYSWDITNYNPC